LAGFIARHRLNRVYSLEDFEKLSKSCLPRAVYEYVRNGAGTEFSLHYNEAAFHALLWQPYRLRQVDQIRTGITIFGETYSAPFGLAPTGGAAMVRYDADRLEARAAHHHDTPYILSANSLTPLEDVFAINPRTWFAPYFPDDYDVIDGMIARLERVNCRVMVVTVDVPVAAKRIAEQRAGYAMPIRPNLPAACGALAHPGWLFDTLLRNIVAERKPRIENIRAQGGPGIFSKEIKAVGGSPRFDWAHVRHIRDRWKHTLILKGLLRADDTEKARDIGVDAVVLSNHGARQIDTTISPMEALMETRARLPDYPLIIDGGFRSGNDVLKAMALGANLVLMGRPFLQACAVAGESGVAKAITLVKEDIARCMAILGVTQFDQLKEVLIEN